MNFLVIGSGAREHIIGEKLSQTGASVYSVIKNLNPGLISFSKDILFVRNYANSQKIILDFSLNNKIDCVVIGPEDPLAGEYTIFVNPIFVRQNLHTNRRWSDGSCN